MQPEIVYLRRPNGPAKIRGSLCSSPIKYVHSGSAALESLFPRRRLDGYGWAVLMFSTGGLAAMSEQGSDDCECKHQAALEHLRRQESIEALLEFDDDSLQAYADAIAEERQRLTNLVMSQRRDRSRCSAR